MTVSAPRVARARPARALGGVHRIDARWMIGLGFLALALRLWFVLSVGQTANPFNDAGIYDAIARNLAHGHGFRGVFGQPTAQWPPVWPFLLSLAYRVFGAGATTGEVLNAFLGALTVPLFYFGTLRTLGRREAIVVGLGTTLLLGQIFWTDLLLSETLTTFLIGVLVAMLAVLSPRSRRSALLVGMVLGVLALTRGEGVALILIPAAMWWRSLPRHLFRQQIAIVLAVVLAFIVPWTIRNELAMHAFIPVSTNFGSTFWSGHNPSATGGPTYPSERLLAQIKTARTDPRRELQIEKLLEDRALNWMLSHPLDELKLIPLKVLYLNAGDSQAIGLWLTQQSSRQRPILSSQTEFRLSVLADFETFALLAAFLASLLVYRKVLWRRRILRGILAFLGVSLVLYGFVFYGNFRYRSALEPLMLMVAAPLLVRIWALRTEGQR